MTSENEIGENALITEYNNGYRAGYDAASREPIEEIEEKEIRMKAIECASRLATGKLRTSSEELIQFSERLVKYIHRGT